MIELKHFDLAPDEALQDQLQLISIEAFAELSALPLPASNPLQSLYQYVLGFELHRYFQRMQEAHHAKPKLICAFAAPNQTLIGFALYLPYLDTHDACALLKLWVAKPYRSQAVGQTLLTAITMRYRMTQVACRADQAEYFRRHNFYPLYAHGPQVLLSTVDTPCHGTLALEPLEPIFASKHAQSIQHYLLKQHGVNELKYAYQQRDRLLKTLTQDAQTWVAKQRC